MEPFIGEIRMFAGNFAPRQYAFCDGQLLSVSQNDALFSLLGTMYGGDGRTTFALPDLRGRVPIHQGQGPGLSQRRMGQRGGAEAETVSAAQIPGHTHVLQGTAEDATSRDPAGRLPAVSTDVAYGPSQSGDLASLNTLALGNNTGNQPHSNVMPFQCVNYIIALYGVYPSRS